MNQQYRKSLSHLPFSFTACSFLFIKVSFLSHTLSWSLHFHSTRKCHCCLGFLLTFPRAIPYSNYCSLSVTYQQPPISALWMVGPHRKIGRNLKGQKDQKANVFTEPFILQLLKSYKDHMVCPLLLGRYDSQVQKKPTLIWSLVWQQMPGTQ